MNILILKKKHKLIKIIKEDKIIDQIKIIEIEDFKKIINHSKIKESNGEIRINKDKKYYYLF